MAGERPAYSTVPHGFHFHYSDDPPKTPEREAPSNSTAERPPSARGFRVKRRSRPRLNTSISSQTSEIMAELQDTPLPSIEVSEQHGDVFTSHFDDTRRNERFLSPFQARPATVPRTPSAQMIPFTCDWTPSQRNEIGQSIIRPGSAQSSLSDSSDDSLMSSDDGFSFGGSCTSPESDAPDPFSFGTPVKTTTHPAGLLETFSASVQGKALGKPRWTKEMDNHIWAIYLTYLNDPTVTPFKTLPGIPPPVGVCHRVAREARRSWKGGRIFSHPRPIKRVKQLKRDGSPDTVTERSGSATPTFNSAQKHLTWPGSGSATRKRFRELCKRKATIAPHYQRMLQSRSPSPFLAHNQAGMRSTKAGSPFVSRDAFGTREVAVSLASSTATSMQPNAPLARMSDQQTQEWFNDPEVPWASPPPIPSDIDNGNGTNHSSNAPGRLGSPFLGSHTWGPSNSRRRERPSIAPLQVESASSVPRLRSPVHFASMPRGAIPGGLAPKTPKRPAQTELEDEQSGGEGQSRRNRIEDIFGGTWQSARRRLRARGMSLEDRFTSANGSNLFGIDSQPTFATAGPSSVHPRPNSSSMNLDPDPFVSAPGEDIRRLGSPFAGISTRPTRARGRHISSHSLSSYNPDEMETIDQRLNQSATMGPF